MIKNVFKSLLKLLIGLAPLGALSIMFILLMFTGPGPESKISSYIGDNLIYSEQLDDQGMSFEDVADYTLLHII